jgi:hypothetical protein
MNKTLALAGAAFALAIGSVAIAQTYQDQTNQPAAGEQNQPAATDPAPAADTTATDTAADTGSATQMAGERG